MRRDLLRARLVAAIASALALAVAAPRTAYAERRCTLIVDARENPAQDAAAPPLVRDGAICEDRVTPASTFKLALAVMGFDAGILTGAHEPVWHYREEYHTWNERWKHATDPTSWLDESVVWYSQVLTRSLGMARLQRYVDGFGYGNRDLRGDPGKRNGLTNAWLTSSLRITPGEQAVFLGRLLARRLPATRDAIERAIAVVPVFPVAGGWTVHGKTGTGYQFDARGRPDESRPVGWFVGWADRADRRLIVVRLVEHDPADGAGTSGPSAGILARDALLADLPALVQ